MGTNAAKVNKNLSNKCSQKLLYSVTKSRTDAFKTASKRAINNTAEATGNLIGNKIAGKISVSKKSRNDLDRANNEIEISKERCIFPELLCPINYFMSKLLMSSD